METVLCGVGDIFHCVGLNNNRFIDNLKRYFRAQKLLNCIFKNTLFLSNLFLLSLIHIFPNIETVVMYIVKPLILQEAMETQM